MTILKAFDFEFTWSSGYLWYLAPTVVVDYMSSKESFDDHGHGTVAVHFLKFYAVISW